MPTIIDSLVVQLGLDPKGFTQGQQQAVQNLRALQNQTQQTVGNIQTQLTSLGQFFSKIGQPIVVINQNLNNLSAVSRRTGSAVAAGAQAGAAGLSEMASAGLAAYSALKSVQGILKQVADASSAGANVGRVAARTGVSTHWLSSFELAAQRMANVSPDTSGNALNEYQQKFTAFRERGDYSQAFTGLAQLGIDFSKPLPEQIMQIANVLASKNGPQAQFWAGQIGLGPLIDVLRQGAPKLQQTMAQVSPLAVTDRQTEAYQRLQTAISSVFQAFDGLVNKFVERHPELTRTIEDFAKWITALQGTREGLDKLETAFELVAAGIGAMLVGIVGKFVWANTAILRTPLGLFLLGSYLAYKALPEGIGTDKYQGPGAQPKADDQPFSWYKPWTWYHHNNDAATAPVPPRGGGPGSSGRGAGVGGDPRGQEANIRAAAIANGLNPDDVVAVARAEGLGAAWKTWDVNGYSYGGFQMHQGGLGTAYQRATGRDYTDPANEAHMNAWAIAYGAKHGFRGDWTSVSGGRVREPRHVTAGEVAAAGQLGLPPGVRRNSAGGLYAAELDTPNAARDANVAASMAAIKASMNGGAPWANKTSNTTVGDVNVHVPAGADAYKIGTATANALKRVVSQTNTALE